MRTIKISAGPEAKAFAYYPNALAPAGRTMWEVFAGRPAGEISLIEWNRRVHRLKKRAGYYPGNPEVATG